tara:strand:+ start:480 stop:725 length:246 start_codon:yes stop_codon:yes gene_type:complete
MRMITKKCILERRLAHANRSSLFAAQQVPGGEKVAPPFVQRRIPSRFPDNWTTCILDPDRSATSRTCSQAVIRPGAGDDRL